MNAQNRPLWAPWRVEFVYGEKESGCFFCGKKEYTGSREEELIVKRMEHCFVMLNRYPYNAGHLLITPYEHCAFAKDLLQKLMKPDGYNAGFNLGTAAGAGVAEHLHLHLVPRWFGDTSFMPVLGDVRCVPEALVNTANLLRDAWK